MFISTDSLNENKSLIVAEDTFKNINNKFINRVNRNFSKLQVADGLLIFCTHL